MKRLFFSLSIIIMFLVMSPLMAQEDDAEYGPFIPYGDQELFLNGINLAWVDFSRDLTHFDEIRFVAAIDELAAVNGNTMRWWLHTNGANSPQYGDDGFITGLSDGEIETLVRAISLAYERGILITPTLWSHDMLSDQGGVPADWNKMLIEDPEATQAYIDNVLIPMVEALRGHPGIVAWEIFNEPEGVTEEFGWTATRTTMPYIQQFVNLLTGAIRRTDPDALITNGSWSFQASTDVGGYYNYYTDERLIEAGGDPDGWLDFYSVHYYPEWAGEETSPFHNPASYWELDKPIVIGEFPARAIADLGMGFVPRRQLRNSMESYQYLLDNGYSGALSWMFYNSDHGDLLDASPGILRINNLIPEHNQVDISEVDRIPVVTANIDNIVVSFEETELADAIDLSTIFSDVEDGSDLNYEFTENTRSDIVEPTITDGIVSLSFSGEIGTSVMEITATDSSGNFSKVPLTVQVIDPDRGNVALGKTTIASSIENIGYLASSATDGLMETRWSTLYADPQWLEVDLGQVFTVSQFVLHWETAFGDQYTLEAWDGSEWQVVYNELGSDGDIDDIALDEPVDARYVRFNGTRRCCEWGYSLWEFEVFGILSEDADEALEATPESFILAAEEAASEEMSDNAPDMSGDVLHSFESDEEGFILADYWSGGSGIAITDADASDGSQSVAITVSFNGTEWQEAGIYLQPGGLDWSAYSEFAVDVFVPEGATDQLAQIFIKTGDDWTWANTPDIPLVAGEWTSVVADLSTMGEMSAVQEYGIKVGTGATAFEGDILVDNFHLIGGMAMADDSASMDGSALHSFESDEEGFVLADYWSGGSGIAITDADASDGSQSVAITVSFNGTEWQEAGIYLQPGGLDWSAYSEFAVDVFVPEGATDQLAQIFIKTGDDWTWANTPDIPLVAGEWTTVTADLSTMGEMSAVQEYGIKVGTGATAFEGDILIDNFHLIGGMAMADDSASMDGASLHSFESDEEGFVLADYWSGGSGIAITDADASDGSQSVAITVSFNGTEWQEAGIYLQPGGLDWSGYNEFAVDVFVPEGATDQLAQIFIKTGDDWTWANTPDIPLLAGEWTTVTADLSTMGDMSAVQEYGIKVGTGATAFEGDILIDNFRLAGDVMEEASASSPALFAIHSVDALQNSVGLYEKLELIADIEANYDNPYDPVQIRVDGRFFSPSGETVIIPGFYYEDFEYTGSNVRSLDDWSWRVRFTPTEIGDWEYQVLVTTAEGTIRSERGNFTVTESDNPGFIRVDERNPHYFVFDNGEPYFPVGENIGWALGDSISEYDTWLSSLSDNNANFIRVWMASWEFGIEWIDTPLGDYSNRQWRAYELDQVFELMAENDVYAMLSLINHGQFNDSVDPEWANNPYNAANGGPLENPEDFAENPEAIRLWHQRLRYIVARWGYSPNLFTWEWWNEVNWTPLSSANVLAPWVSRSAAYLESLDAYDHLITHSGSLRADESVWGQESMDFVQEHLYNMDDLPQTFSNSIPEWLETYPDKPFLMGEFGSPAEIDTEGMLIHLGLWAAPMNGASGTGMTWWWDTVVHPQDLYYHFDAVAAFYAEEDMGASNWEIAEVDFVERVRARVYGLQTDNSALLWAVNRDYSTSYMQRQYNLALRNAIQESNDDDDDDAAPEISPEDVVIEYPLIEASVIAINGLSAGDYTVEFWDTFTGEVIETVSASSDGEVLELPLPDFDRDIAIKIKPV